MAILGIIPARAGSKRIPNKNKKTFYGKPLISYIIEEAVRSSRLDTVVVNSNDEDILSIASSYENIIPLRRPEEISQDHSKAIEYVHHTIEYFNNKGINFEVVVILQPTSPLTLSTDIDKTIQLLENTNADSSVSIVELAHAINPLKMKVLDGDKLLPYLEKERGRMSADELPKIFIRNCSIYASKIEIIEQGMIIGEDCRGYIMPEERSIDINSPMDFEFAEFLYKKYRQGGNQ